MTDRQLLKKLQDAAVCCKDCGQRYGIYSVGCSSTWHGTCRVCGEQKPITETRDWGYLYKGRRELAAKLGLRAGISGGGNLEGATCAVG